MRRVGGQRGGQAHAAPAFNGGSAGAALVKEGKPGQRMHALPTCRANAPQQL